MLFATRPAATRVTYSASSSVIPNPERGFFQYTETHYRADNSGYTALDQATLTTGRGNGQTQVFRYFYLEKYLVQDSIDSAYLDLVAADLATVRAAGCKLILRFAYSDNPNNNFTAPYDSDPPLSRVLGHINQLYPVLNTYADIIEIVQAGFIGYWGEWYYSDNFTNTPSVPGTLDTTDWDNRGQVLNALLTNLDARIFICVRYVGIHQHFASSWDAATLARVGFHNDAFEASSDDFGTFSTFSSQTVQQNQAYLATMTAANVPMGGESAVNNPPQSSWTNAATDLAAYHWNFLNPIYQPDVLDDWGSTNQTTAAKLLGYRLRLVATTIQASVVNGGNFAVSIVITNDGYAAPLRNRPVKFILTNGGSPLITTLSADVRTWAPEQTTTLTGTIAAPATAGTYTAYLFFPDPTISLATNPAYAIQLANPGVWNSSNGWNNLGQTILVGGGGTITAPGAPTAVSAVAGDAGATVSFTGPADYGGAQITGYAVTSSPGGITATGAASPIVVTGLTNGTSYTFTVTATNSAGTGTASNPSSPVTPTRAPVLQDTFSSGSLNAQWIGSGSYVIVGGTLQITGHSTYADNVISANSFDMTGRTATVQVPSVPTAASGEVFMQLFIDGNNSVSIGKSGTSLVLRIVSAGTTNDTSLTYDAVAHAWWRIGLSGSTLSWSTSPDNSAWTVRRTVSSGYPGLTAVYFRMLVGHYTAEDADQAATFDNVSVV
ncbi:MAG: DUF4832 domain-containing protein [Candidatus Saccharibacteria bacterium]